MTTDESINSRMREISIDEDGNWHKLAIWAEQSREQGGVAAIREVVEIVANRERDNSYMFRFRLQQLGELVDYPQWDPGQFGFYTDSSLSDVEKLRTLVGSDRAVEGMRALDLQFSEWEALAEGWPEPERTLLKRYVFTDRHSAAMLLEAWIRAEPEKALASPVYAGKAAEVLGGEGARPETAVGDLPSFFLYVRPSTVSAS